MCESQGYLKAGDRLPIGCRNGDHTPDAGEFERRAAGYRCRGNGSAAISFDGINFMLDRLTAAHNADMAAQARRIAELEAQVEQLEEKVLAGSVSRDIQYDAYGAVIRKLEADKAELHEALAGCVSDCETLATRISHYEQRGNNLALYKTILAKHGQQAGEVR